MHPQRGNHPHPVSPTPLRKRAKAKQAGQEKKWLCSLFFFSSSSPKTLSLFPLECTSIPVPFLAVWTALPLFFFITENLRVEDLDGSQLSFSKFSHKLHRYPILPDPVSTPLSLSLTYTHTLLCLAGLPLGSFNYCTQTSLFADDGNDDDADNAGPLPAHQKKATPWALLGVGEVLSLN